MAAGAETPPPELSGIADLITVTLPWGSLLAGMLGRSPAVAEGLAALLRRDGTIEALVSTSVRDGRGLPRLDQALAPAVELTWRPLGLSVADLRPATDAELAATSSTWARRLRLGQGHDGPDGRTAWRLTLRRSPRTPLDVERFGR